MALTNPVRRYAWGSYTAIAGLQGRHVPSPTPEAELWLGAHPSAPSMLTGPGGGVPLSELIASDPQAVLGDEVVARFGPRLPYLLKFLAAAQPLSLQAHPDAEAARTGYERENALAAVVRNYVDPYHKPELLVAVEEFDALCGFRDPARSADELESFGVAALAPVVAALRTGTVRQRLRAAVGLLLGLPGSVVAQVRANTAHPLVSLLARTYPDDVGVIVALLLNRVRLRPGDAVFIPNGALHAYLSGVGVEIMAASDNVLRGGLTPKHVDIAELTRILRYEVLAEPVVQAVPLGPSVLGWKPPVDEFSLIRAEIDADSPEVALPGGGPRIVLCLSGTARLRAGAEHADLARGESVFVAAHEPPVSVTGTATVFQASPAV